MNSHGKLGGDKHYQLIKKSAIRLIDNYYNRYSQLTIENSDISVSSRLGQAFDSHFPSIRGKRDLEPDIMMVTNSAKRGKNEETSDTQKVIIVEAETTKDNLLNDSFRLTAYKLLREAKKDKNKLMLYIAFPEKLKGLVDKPGFFNDLWFFEVGDSE